MTPVLPTELQMSFPIENKKGKGHISYGNHPTCYFQVITHQKQHVERSILHSVSLKHKHGY